MEAPEAAIEEVAEEGRQETGQEEEAVAPQALQQPIGNKLKWFFIRLVFKVTLVARLLDFVSCLTLISSQMFLRLLKVVALGAVVFLCYEAAMQGTEATR